MVNSIADGCGQEADDDNDEVVECDTQVLEGVHSGEWRGSRFLNAWCKFDQNQPGNHMCKHGAVDGDLVIRAPHWSCCGNTAKHKGCLRVNNAGAVGLAL